MGHSYSNGECTRCGEMDKNYKWSYTDAYNLNTYAKNASTYALDAYGFAVDAMTGSTAYKVYYNKLAVNNAGYTKQYLERMKTLADSKAVFNLTTSSENYSTVQGKINYAYSLCEKIVGLEITEDNYATYATLINDTTQELSAECLGIQSLSLQILEMFQ